ncbi:MAG: glycine cleavage system aminomethyltransferase GcvT [Parachlamydiaceae bacterium]
MKTPLYDHHVRLNARIVDFHGWQLPLQYSGILDEYWAVRKHAALFDVSHMLRIDIEGKDSLAFLNCLTTNTIDRSITYTLLTNEKGGIVDDTLLYKLNDDAFFIVANGARRNEDLAHLEAFKNKFNVKISPREEMILAFQGPESENYFSPLKRHTFLEENGILRSATGYTGEKGFEFYGPKEKLIPLFEELIAKGIKPAGLGARDILRLEMGYALYGHELNETLKPQETVSAWAVKNKPYIGRTDTQEWFASALVMDSEGIPREGYSLFRGDEKIGHVTSGGFSPRLQKGIALILTRCKLSEKDRIKVDVRGKIMDATITKTPFIKL